MKLDEMAFKVPKELEASAPSETRGQPRDHVRLLVIHRDSGQIEHRRFYEIVEYLKPGDVVVLNVSRTVPAALARRDRRRAGRLNCAFPRSVRFMAMAAGRSGRPSSSLMMLLSRLACGFLSVMAR